MKMLMLVTVMVPWMVGAATMAKTDVYALETDAFLAARDGCVQTAQIVAIRRATAGETDDLKAVRICVKTRFQRGAPPSESTASGAESVARPVRAAAVSAAIPSVTLFIRVFSSFVSESRIQESEFRIQNMVDG